MTQLVFIHSTGLGPFMWKPFLGRIEGAVEWTPTNRGYAPGERIERPQPSRLQDDVDHLLQQIPSEEPVHLVAHSWGATLALDLAVTGRLPVASLWLYEPVLFGSLARDADRLDDATRSELDDVLRGFRGVSEADGGHEAWLESFVDYWNGRGAWQAMGERARDSMRAVGWKMFQEVRGVFEDVRPFADYRTAVPVTLVVGGQSPRPARAMVQRLAEEMPHAVRVDVGPLGHMGVLHAAPLVVPTLIDHMDRLRSHPVREPAAP